MKQDIQSEHFKEAKRQHEQTFGKLGIPFEGRPVDLNHAFVPQDVSQKAKTRKENLKQSNDTNLERLGL